MDNKKQSSAPRRTFNSRGNTASGGTKRFASKSFGSHGTKKREGFSPRKSSSPSRGRSFGGGRSRGRKMNTQKIDIQRFVKKAEPIEQEVSYTPTHLFTDFNLLPELQEVIKSRGYQKPSPIQDQSIPASLEGRDVLGIANTGTGKTAAFLLPIIQSLLQNKKQKALILAPTRELALQIEKEFRLFTHRDMKLFSVSIVGGAPMGPQKRELERGVHFMIGTPGRVQDMIRRGLVRLDTISHMVLDEVDQMLDMGFVDEITEILNSIPKKSQKYFFSATLEQRINTLIDTFLTNPLKVILKGRDTSKNVEQNIIRTSQGSTKIKTLCDVLSQKDVSKTIIFAETKRDVQKLSDELSLKGFKTGSLHGDKRHRERVRILDDFKKNQISILVATDVAARGLDVPDISHVINYEIPKNYETYVHRVGRTGRANKRGYALTFVS